jgi:hypothetical protein
VNLEPLTYEFMLRCSAEGAFATYTARIAEWWHPRYTANAETLQSVTIESRLGGRVYATHSDLGEHDWGKVTEWEPDRRFAHTFSLAQDLENPSNVSVEFASEEGGCTVRFAHGGWNEANAEAREKFGEWPVLLDRFAALANQVGA